MSERQRNRGCIVLVDNQPHVRMSEKALALLAESNEVIRLEFGYSKEELFRSLRRADVVISVMAPITVEMMDAALRLKGIVTFGVGYDFLDVCSATEHSIYISNTRGANAEAVAELTFSMMLNLMRKTWRADSLIRAGEWQRGIALPSWLSGSELWRRTLGILGLGNVGRRVARIATGFEMQVLGYDPYVSREAAENVGVTLAELPKIFHEADIVTVHVPLSAETEGLVNAERLALMKPTACLINLSRGPVVEEGALIEALREGRIAGAGLDVFDVEPLPADHPLLKLDNVIMTPHIGGFTEETMGAASMSVARRALQVVAGDVPDNLVNDGLLGESSC